MRVHGEIEIKRRVHLPKISQQSARTMLEEDFGGLCGYCGKNGQQLRACFHVDHFVPKSLDPDREKDYSNFVWACPKCNQIKSNQWPTGDKTVPYRDGIGFVDPASPEFNQHLVRTDSGRIVGRTPLGMQMCRLLNFHLRKTELFWKAEQLRSQMERMREKNRAGLLSPEQCQYYVEMDTVLQEILDALYAARE